VENYPQGCGFLTGALGREYGAFVRLRALTEAECYARCYGDGDDNVRFVKLEPRRPRYDIGLSGEELRQAFETRLDKREPIVDPGVEPAADVGDGREPAAAA
jgi:hypothetical protein